MPIISEEMIDEKLIVKIQQRSLRLAVLGSGYVGLPTAALFADSGFHVIAVDFKSEVVNAVNSGASPFSEPGLKELISHNVQAGKLKATLKSAEALNQADAVIISVQTPIDENTKPNLSFLTKALEDVGKNIKRGMLAIISSTLPPGTMLRKVKPKLEFLSGLEAETEFHLAYVPERIAPGKAIKEFIKSPRLVGGIGSNSTKVAAELFRTVCEEVVEADAATTEVAKLAENTFRDVNIAFANQLALMCEQLGVDVTEVIELANTHPRVHIHTPGPGVGGPCLPKDPYLLLHSLSQTDHRLIGVARQINDKMPKHILSLILQALENAGKDATNSKIAVLGTAYKGNVNDPRLAPSEIVICELLRLGSKVISYDPLCDDSFGAKKVKSLYEAIENADCIAIITDHTEFRNIDLKRIRALMTEKPAIVDGRRMINPQRAERLGFTYYGIGLGNLSSR